jgi:hypothetical protein
MSIELAGIGVEPEYDEIPGEQAGYDFPLMVRKLERVLCHHTGNKNRTHKLRGLSPRANYTNRETAACQPS